MNKSSNILKYVKKYKSRSYFLKNLVATFFIFILPFSIVLAASYNNMNDSLFENISTTAKNNTQNLSASFDRKIKEIEYLCYYTSNLSDTIIIVNSGDSVFSSSEIFNRLTYNFEAHQLVDDSIYAIDLYSARTDKAYSSVSHFDTYSQEKTLEKFHQNVEKFGNRSGVDYGAYCSLSSLFSVYVPILPGVNSQNILGGLMIYLNAKKLNDYFTVNEKDDYFIISGENKILYSSNNIVIGDNLENIGIKDKIFKGDKLIQWQTDTHIFTTEPLSGDGMYSLYSVPLSNYADNTSELFTLLLFYIITIIITSALFSIAITFMTGKPIAKLLKIFNQKNQIDESDSEVDYLANNIMVAVTENALLEETLKHKLEMFNNSKMIALQTQINPHFLYNTLENIKWTAMALTKGENDVSFEIEQLGRLLRYSLEIEPSCVTILEELKNLNIYFNIINKRQGDIHKINWDIDKSIEHCKIPRITLQPIVENAYTHGIRSIKTGGYISISIHPDKDLKKVIVEVKNNGFIISKEKIDEINEKLSRDDKIFHKHIGLVNVAQRLKLSMGNDSCVRIFINEKDETVVRIVFDLVE